ncbi:sulfhydryl oxidase [Elysia marginata]|uniref:Sulfhydryl oxidase n=1 Tax=Elysia marginata TaxID=1093978 RepID=A0AAV4H8H8_9GAST|nr:sulfhydryl oxidase [Elysia marginata]
MEQGTEKKRDIKELIEMGLSPQGYKIHTTASTDSATSTKTKSTLILTKENVIKHLSKEPGIFHRIQKEKDELLVEKTKPTQQRYDPYSFLDKMAMPFDVPRSRPGDPKKNGASSGAGGDKEGPGGKKKAMPHCKSCTDFKTWMELTANPRRNMSRQEREEKQCPLDSTLLGNNTWSFLHTMAAYYPEKPSAEQQNKMKSFISLLSDFYPCHKCAANLREDLKTDTPDTRSNTALSQWFCELHNKVNVRLGKAEFDCSKVLERWRDGWADGTCD